MDDRLCAADEETVGGAGRFVAIDEHGPRLDRDYVNRRIRQIVLAGLPAIQDAQTFGERTADVNRLIDSLITHVDETVDAALAFVDERDEPFYWGSEKE